jgi:hypothetical protein
MTERDEIGELADRIRERQRRARTSSLILGLLFAWQEGAMTTLEFVERVRGAVPNPLAQQ